MAQSERRYKVEKYLEMARLTKNGDRKEGLIDKAEYFLEIGENELSNGYEEYDEIEYFKNLELEDIVNKPSAVCYKEYENYCHENGDKIVSKTKFGTLINRKFNTYSKKVSTGQFKNSRCYALKGE